MRIHSGKTVTAAGFMVAALAAGAWSQGAANPAARTHVRVVNNVPLKYTSKLAQVVELNFTLGFTHDEGKRIITAALDRIAKNYAMGGKDAFTLRKFTTSNVGSASGEMTNFTLSDLMAGEVMVANNISSFNELQAKSAAQATAVETAIKTEGRGMLSFHGSGDGGGGWAFYTNDLHPVGYKGHGSRTDGTVYKYEGNKSHLVLQNILETGTQEADVPMDVDASGNEVLRKAKTRRMLNEWYWFSRNLLADAKYKPLTQPMLKYDPRDLDGGALETQYKYKGGNLYSFHLRIGAGKVCYLPAGHDNSELMAAGTSFNGGTGDYDRYLAQNLFYLAGYKTEVCAGTACDGLPVVNAQEQLTGETWKGSTALFERDRPAFASHFDAPYAATLSDVAGRVVAGKRGTGKVEHAFDVSSLQPGLYFMRVRIGRAAPKARRYAVHPKH